VLLRRRTEKGLLGGMMEIPSTEWTKSPPKSPQRAAPLAAEWKRLRGKVEHTFTHFHLELAVLRAAGNASGDLDGSYRWVPREQLEAEALPALMRKVVALATQGK
jgi:A/G-specific adenine glycosylase